MLPDPTALTHCPYPKAITIGNRPSMFIPRTKHSSSLILYTFWTGYWWLYLKPLLLLPKLTLLSAKPTHQPDPLLQNLPVPSEAHPIPIHSLRSSPHPTHFLGLISPWLEEHGLCITAIPTKKCKGKISTEQSKGLRELKGLKISVTYDKEQSSNHPMGSQPPIWLLLLGMLEA